MNKKSYKLNIPQALFEEIKNVSEENNTTVLKIMQDCFKLGLVFYEYQKEPDCEFLIRNLRTGDETKILIIT